MPIQNYSKGRAKHQQEQNAVANGLKYPDIRLKKGGLVVGKAGKGYTEIQQGQQGQVLTSDDDSETGFSWGDTLANISSIPFEVGTEGEVGQLKLRYLEGNLPASATVTIEHGCKGKILNVSVQAYNDNAGYFQNTQDEHGFTEDGNIKITSLHADFQNNAYRIMIFYLAE